MSKRVLIVEDEPHITEALVFLLGQAGFDVGVESNGRQALTRLEATPPDVLILDAMLPELDGYQILRSLRAAPGSARLPVVMLTAKGQPRDREAALECGADRFMTKPFSNAELVATVKELAELS